MNSNYSNIATLNASLQEHIIKSDTSYREKKLHVGWLGVVFGSGENSPINIAGITAFLSLLAGFMAVQGICL